jgi:hypothetical protein
MQLLAQDIDDGWELAITHPPDFVIKPPDFERATNRYD